MVAISLLSVALATVAGVVTASPMARRATSPAPTPTTPAQSDGFPTPNAQQLQTIQQNAGGTLSNAPPPPKLANSSLAAFQLIAYNENFEVAYFKSLLQNVTAGTDGFQSPNQTELVKILTNVVAQEELHAITAAGILTHFGVFSPAPCTYQFPTTKLADALALAATFTDVVLGTLQDASQLLATNGDAAAVRAIASVIGQEGEQNGFYRSFLSLLPSAKPFLTTSVADYAYSALQSFVVECPFPASNLPFTAFTPLNVISGQGGADVDASNQTLSFSANLTSVSTAKSYIGGNGTGLYVTYLTGQNQPASEPVSNVTWSGSVATFQAAFPFEANVAYGLSIAALTTSNNFSSPDDLPQATLAAPGLIQVNDQL